MIERSEYITTNEAADVLGVTRQRVLQLIQDGRLKAKKFGNVYMIQPTDLSKIEAKPMGRPPKQKKESGPVKESTNSKSTKKADRK